MIGVTDASAYSMEEYMRKKLDTITSQGVKDPHRYFNGGITHFSIESMDVECYYRRIVETLANNQLAYQDQDLLNIIFADTHKLAPCRYNYQATIWTKQFDRLEEGE